MRFYIKQHVFTWGDKFSIYGEDNTEKYYVEGEVFTFGKKLHVYDAATAREVAYIEQKIFSFLPKYYIYKNGDEVAEVVKEFTFFRHEYSVNGPNWMVQGDFFDHEYEFFDGEGVVTRVSKQWFTWGDAYEIDISSTVDEVTALAAALVIDACIDAERD